ncbi:MAG: murein biosynthesis integral membrane protein MurJ [Candidatus Dormibacteraeota bacterium]|nr:murein biosynthesis integral membrane protein MurJ [Candidatus Dormibacteraeota bacterium]
MAAATLVVGAAFVLSRLLGLVRDQLIAAHFGVTDALDTYNAAFRVPDTLFALVIGGAVGSAFIPVFSGLLEQRKMAAAWRLTSTLINASVVLLALGGILLALLAPSLVALVIAPGFPPDKQARTVELTRIMLLSPLFLGLGGWAQGILNARHNFTASALAPIAYNGGIIVGVLFLAPRWDVQGLAAGVVLGALLHFLVQVPSLIRTGMHYQPLHLDLHDEGAGQVGRLVLPRIVGQAAFQANIVVTTAIASTLPGGDLSAFNYAYLLLMLPYGVIAMSLATVLFPHMTAQVGRGDLAAMQRTLSNGLRTVLFLLLPAAVSLGFMRREIVGLLFQFGKFHQGSTELVARALEWFAWGLLAYGVAEILTRAYYALQDTRTPVVVSFVTVLLNLGMSWFLVHQLGADHSGLAFSLSFTTTLEMIGLLLFLRPRLPGLFDRPFLRAVGVGGLGAALMAAALWLLVPWLELNVWAYPNDPVGQKVATAIQLAVGGGVGLGLYLLVARLFRAEELGAVVRLLRRR